LRKKAGSSGQSDSAKTASTAGAGAKSGSTAGKTAVQKAGSTDASGSANIFAQETAARLDNVVRLYHLRQADIIAEAINKASSKDKPVACRLGRQRQQ
jgi:hypothetical protein